MNTNGADIYIRPAESQGLVLVDDLGLGTLDRMDAEGCNPAAVTETSPQNYQAWVRLSHDHLDTSCKPNAAVGGMVLATHLDWRHYGRLAGFTNHKPIYNRPYALAARCNGKTAEKAAELLAEARSASRQRKHPTQLEAPHPRSNRLKRTATLPPMRRASTADWPRSMPAALTLAR